MQAMTTIQHPNVAGLFYPRESDVLKHDIEHFLAEQPADPTEDQPPKAMIVPHAGYIYSGAIAASAYRKIIPFADTIERVAVFAPSHRVGFDGLALSPAQQFRTPLGDIRVDTDSCEQLAHLPQVQWLPRAFQGEHALEVQLPFLQQILGDFSLIPIIVGNADAASVEQVMGSIWGGQETLIIVSSDLSHFLDYPTAQEHDQATNQQILALSEQHLSYEDACGRNPLRGLLRSARQHHLKPNLLDLRNSGDTAGSKDRVVGYGAYVFT